MHTFQVIQNFGNNPANFEILKFRFIDYILNIGTIKKYIVISLFQVFEKFGICLIFLNNNSI